MKYRYPPTASRLGSLINAGRFIKNPIPILETAVEKLGQTYTFFMGGMEKAILTTDPVAARHVLQKHHKAYEKSAIVTDILARYVGHGLLTSTGDHWLRQRRLIQPGFQRKRIDALSVLMQKEVDACMEQWTVYHASQKKFDAYVEMNQLTFRIVAKALFSTSIEAPCALNAVSGMLWHFMQALLSATGSPAMRPWGQLSLSLPLLV